MGWYQALYEGNGRGEAPGPRPRGLKLLAHILRWHWWTLVKTNILFCLFCLPVVTIPPALYCLHKCCWQLIQNKPAGFFAALRETLRGGLGRAWGAFALSLPLLAFAGYGCWFYLGAAGQNPLLLVPFAFCMAVFWVVLLASGGFYALLCAGRPLGRDTLVRALALAFLHPGRALAGAACHYGLPALAILLLPFSGAYLVLIGFSIPCLLGCLFTQKNLERVLGQTPANAGKDGDA